MASFVLVCFSYLLLLEHLQQTVHSADFKFNCPAINGVHYYPDQQDCSHFYLCLGSAAFRMSCPNGFFFNAQTLKCGASNANCIGAIPTTQSSKTPRITSMITTRGIMFGGPGFSCAGGNDSSLHPDTTNCYYFYQCAGSIAYRLPCADALQFNPKTNRCDFPANVKCTYGGRPLVTLPPTVSPGLCTGNNDTSLHPDKTNCYYFYQCIGLKAYRLACPTGLQFNVVKNRCDYPSNVKCVYGGSPPTVAPPKAGFSCPPGTVHDFYPDVTNCSNFYECSDGNAFHKSCRYGLYFNPSSKVCDFPSNVNCPVSGGPVVNGFPCPSGNGTSLHPDKTNCYYFYQCVGLKAYRMPCPTGLQFNVVKYRCDYPANAKCIYGGSPPPTIAPSTAGFYCPPGTVHDFYSDVNNCSNFYECSDGNAFHKSCRNGLYFNPSSKVCDFPSNVNCPFLGVTSDFRCPGNNDTSLHPDKKNCYYFYQCIGLKAYHMPCPTGLQFNAANVRCDYPANAKCIYGGSPLTVVPPTTGFSCPLGTVHNYYPDVNNCSNFYECSDGNAFHKSCRNGLYFNPSSKVCDFPSNVNCPSTPGVTSGFHCTGDNDTSLHPDKVNCYYFYQCIGLTAYRMPCPTGLQFNVMKNRCDYPANSKCIYGGSPATVKPPLASFSCPPGIVHDYFADVRNCSNFYQCTDGNAYLKTCKTGLFFNPTSKVCDFPSHVQCSTV